MVALLLTSSAHAHGAEEGASLLERYLDLITDPAHILLEMTLILVVDVLLGALLWPLVIKPLVRRWIARHDAEHHHGHTTEEHS